MAVGAFDSAVEAADAAMALAPDRSEVQVIYGQAYLSHARSQPAFGSLGKVKAGRAALERAIALDPDNLEARRTLMQFLLQAPGFIGGSRKGAAAQAGEIERRDRVEGVLARLEIALASDDESDLAGLFAEVTPMMGGTGDPGARVMGEYLRAAAGLRDRKRREALTAAVYRAHPGRPVAAYHRARLWVIERKEPAAAERLLLGYLRGVGPRSGSASPAGAHQRLGQLYARTDRDEEARRRFRLAGSLDSRLAGRIEARATWY